MSRTVLKPGPSPNSCLTCRRRRKKCDLSKPRCERCLKGGYECLGYETRGSRTIVNPPDRGTATAPRSRPISLGVSTEAVRSEARESVIVGLAEDRQDSADPNLGYNPAASILGAALLYRINRLNSPTNEDNNALDSSEEFDRLWPQDQNQLIIYSRSRTRRSSCSRLSFDEIPQDQSQRASSWFMTPPTPIRDFLVARLKESKRLVSTIYLGTKLLHTLSEDPCSPTVRGCISLIDNMEQKLVTASRIKLPINDVAERLMAQVELSFLKFTAVDTASGYISLQKALPMLLELVATDTSLYAEYPKGNLVVSLPHTLAATRPEIKQFVMYDIVASFLLGTPPLVEYGYDGECDSRSHGLEWVHGVPVALVQVISQVNSWRAGSRAAPLGDWRELERRVLDWKPQFVMSNDKDSAISNDARRAVQESWRHVALIYIYMGICGVSSHDSRVQESVHRIVQLGETVAHLPISVQMFAHCVIAGLALRLEKHRLLVYEKLHTFKDMRVWFFRGPQFSQVLYHLWHGVGAGGAPVTWDDYIQSRWAVIPI
ncbi:hypothetical protein OPQ81_000618 [Rhizoctonia solani]|nr:hypothetical protein OPQ81_000618 [Rhizoctonia solani]